jgi:hypothetical protein
MASSNMSPFNTTRALYTVVSELEAAFRLAGARAVQKEKSGSALWLAIELPPLNDVQCINQADRAETAAIDFEELTIAEIASQ